MSSNDSHDDKLSKQWPNLADERLGSQVIYANDEFFAEKENLVKPGRGIFIDDKYTDRGKWMDGWETRRRRAEGNDFCIIKLGLPGRIRGLDIDTNHFLGNHAPFASVEACLDPVDPLHVGEDQWVTILPRSPLDPGSQNFFEIFEKSIFSHLRLQIYPDGGVARFRVYGDVAKDWSKEEPSAVYDLISLENGGRVLSCNDSFFSSKDNLIYPGRGKNMGDGWETRRKRHPGHDWVILALGARGVLEKIEIDTAHFKGNFPDRCSIDVSDISTQEHQQSLSKDSFDQMSWTELVSQQKLEADTIHVFDHSLIKNVGAVTHLKLNIFPDGGVSRLRAWGKLL